MPKSREAANFSGHSAETALDPRLLEAPGDLVQVVQRCVLQTYGTRGPPARSDGMWSPGRFDLDNVGKTTGLH